MTPATIDAAKLGAWLDTALTGPSATVGIEQSGQVARPHVLKAERAGVFYALDIPAAGAGEPDAAGFDRKLLLLKGLAKSPIQHPRLVAACPDAAVLGAPFLVTQWVEGFTLGHVLPEAYRTGSGARSLAEELVDGLVAITIANWPAMGLSGFSDPDNFLQRQVDQWLARSRGLPLPGLDAVRDWVSANVPPTQRKTLVHGDYGFPSTIFSPSQPPRMAAIVKWDSATVGDPMLDLGDLLAGWPDPDEPAPRSLEVDWSLFPSRTELVRRYAQRTALGIANLKFYFAFALFKQAVGQRGDKQNAAVLARAKYFAGLA